MDLDWTDFPDAPEMGAFLCQLDDIPKGGAFSKDVDGFPIVAVVADDGVRVFVNACPHQFLPLDQRGGELLSADGRHLMCSNHQAMFRTTDGQGTAGEGVGCRLSLIPTAIINGSIHIKN